MLPVCIRSFLVTLIIICLPSLSGLAAGQETSGSREQEGPPIRVFVEEVTVSFTVTDNNNRLVTDLSKEDFRVLEDKQPQEIVAFSRETETPLRIGLLIDTSASIRDRLAFEQRAAADFLRALLRPSQDKAFLGSFDSIAELVQDFTDDLDSLVEAINSLRAGGGTALYDAIYYSCRDRLLEEAPPNGMYRRALIILSDGEDNQSRYSRSQAVEMAQRAEVTVFAISTNLRGIRTPGDRVLRQVAEETGGRYFQPANVQELEDTFDTINAELRSQYALSYRPSTPRDGKYHQIEIVPQKKDLRVRARRGYFAVAPAEARPSEGSR